MPVVIFGRLLNKISVVSEQTSPFRRWTTGSGAGSSYRHHDHRNMYNKQMSEGTPPMPPTGACGGVARWSLGLDELLADPAGAAAFAHFLSKEFAAENIRFWWLCEQYRATEDSARRASMAQQIWQRHLAEGASEPVNVDATARRATAARLHIQPAPTDLFLQTQKQIFNVMKFDSYPRFLRSGVHAECARADLRGLPPPYAHALEDRTAHDTPSKLKKSASNASERRRSGGSSLLPWKLRAPSRDRSHENAQGNAPSAQTTPVTDVVKTTQNVPGQCSLCRVVLPDGATSVVGVEESVTVRRLVDRLLQRRNLVCTTYDVLLRDTSQTNEDKTQLQTIDLNSPSTILGGREAVVERRVVLRVEVNGRSVAVRCRPARRLRHVLKPVLARFARDTTQRRVMRDGVEVPPDTLMQELDGARLQIISVAAEEGAGERDDDADSLSELALRLQDDGPDAESQSGSTSSLKSSRGEWCAGAGRVRAALRPGPPLHHHPPDFLENLRETQRQRLTKPEPPAAPSPRSPPPLPPKPPQRTAPTVV